jgi:hypothetical protein
MLALPAGLRPETIVALESVARELGNRTSPDTTPAPVLFDQMLRVELRSPASPDGMGPREKLIEIATLAIRLVTLLDLGAHP